MSRQIGAQRKDADAAVTIAALFTLVWEALADVLGTAATATLLRRAAQRALPRSTELAELSITRKDLEYQYMVPAAWENGDGTPRALRELMTELAPLLIELTGPIVFRRLERIPELRRRGIVSTEERDR